MMMWSEVVGVLGMILLLGAFFLASTKRIRDDQYFYHVLNFLGALAVLVNAWARGVKAVAAIEIAWSLIAVVGIWKVYTRVRRPHALE
jgi:hypothetical protein